MSEATGYVPLDDESGVSRSGTLHAFTIVARNYLPQARVLAESLKRHNPDSRLTVVFLDRVDGCFSPEDEPFDLIPAEDLGIPRWDEFAFKYTVLERCTAIKPYCFSHLFRTLSLPNLIYFDPDILVTSSLDELRELIKQYSVILTPHLTQPMPDDGCFPSENDIILSGTYNLGFLALRNDDVAAGLLKWWQNKLYDNCKVCIEKGMFTDQKWMELAPSMYVGVHILRDDGYNVAYWNLATRVCTRDENGEFFCNGRPLRFFHFSGFDPRNMGTCTKHSNRAYFVSQVPVDSLFREYADLLFQHGFEEAADLTDVYSRFSNGKPIPDSARREYHSLSSAERGIFDNPFDVEGASSFYYYLYPEESPAALAQPPSVPVARGPYARVKGVLKIALLPVLRSTLGRNRRLWNALKEARQQLRRPVLAPSPEPEGPQILTEPLRTLYGAAGRRIRAPFGVNLSGHLRADTGVGEGVRSDARALKRTRIPYVLNDMSDNMSNCCETAEGTLWSESRYAVNLVHVNADMSHVFAQRMGLHYFMNRYNIAYWVWELAQFPEHWTNSFNYYDEIWCPSSFVQNCIARVSPAPTIVVPHTIPTELETKPEYDRNYFGLPEDRFLFLFIFDFMSVFERKNPLAIVEAFRKAFDGSREAGLVLKFSRPDYDREAHSRLVEAVDGLPVYMIGNPLSRVEINSLLAASDCYISLHRSEGFGITMAEAMVLEKPVIATGYSGNMDYTTSDNSFLVKYDLVEIEREHFPYPAGYVWADPSVEHAAELMRYVYANPDTAREAALRGRKDITESFSMDAISRIMKDRLISIAIQEGLRIPSQLIDSEDRESSSQGEGAH